MTFNNVTTNNPAGVTLNDDATINGTLNLLGGDLDTGGFTLTSPASASSSGTFDVIGNVESSGFVVGDTLTFGNPNNQITFTGGTPPTSIEVNLVKSAPATYATAVQRTYTITPVAGSGFTATVRLHYLDSELNGNVEANLNLRRLTGTWQAVTPTSARDALNNWVECNAVTGFSQWTFASLLPTASSGSISGTITDAEGSPVAGTVIWLSGTQSRKTITDATGNYRFSNVESTGFYTVTPSRVNYNFSPFNRSFSQLGGRTDAAFAGSFNGDNANPLDTAEYFVRQQYVDVLSREPDETGFNFWSDRILVCGNDAECVRTQRIAVAAQFFIAQEFQLSGSYIYNLYEGALSRRPLFAEYAIDRQQVIGGAKLEAEKQVFAESFVQRSEFTTKYQANTAADSFVDALITNLRQSSGVDLGSQRDAMIAHYNTGANQIQSRSFVLRDLTENQLTRDTLYNAGFVLTEYFGYLRRNPDRGGYTFWLNVVNNGDLGNYHRMVCSFITSTEYQRRFSRVVSHGNGECVP